MHTRRLFTAIGAAAVMAAGTLAGAGPASADTISVQCGKEYRDQAISMLAVRAKSYYKVSCVTLTGNIKSWTIKGWVEDVTPNDVLPARLTVTIGPVSKTVVATNGFATTFTISNAGTTATVKTFV